jgi:RimJ/RimL family protein N-acetyltransferase
MEFSTRQLTTNDWQTLKHIRLEALSLHPNFFSPSSDEFQFSEADWTERLSNPDGATFGLFHNKNEIIGLTGIYRDKKDPQLAWLVASYIQAPYRRKGLTRLLYQARIDWAKIQNHIHTLVVHHREDNEISKKSHQKFNFEFIKTYEPVTWPNDEIAPYVEYRLKIK